MRNSITLVWNRFLSGAKDFVICADFLAFYLFENFALVFFAEKVTLKA